MIAHERALEWQELFDLAASENIPEEEIVNMGYRIAGWQILLVVSFLRNLKAYLSEELSSKRRYSESARVLLDYSKDVREAVTSLVQGNKFSEARRIVSIIVNYSSIIHQYSLSDVGNFARSTRTADGSHISGQSRKPGPS